MAKYARKITMTVGLSKDDLSHFKESVLEWVVDELDEEIQRRCTNWNRWDYDVDIADWLNKAAGGKAKVNKFIDSVVDFIIGACERQTVGDLTPWNDVVESFFYDERQKLAKFINQGIVSFPKLDTIVALAQNMEQIVQDEAIKQKLNKLRYLADELGYTIMKNEE